MSKTDNDDSHNNESSDKEKDNIAKEQVKNAVERENRDATEHWDRPQKRSVDEGHEEEGSFKRRRFEALADDEQNEWHLPEELVMDIPTNASRKSLKDSILLVNPVPTNMPQPRLVGRLFQRIN